MFLRQVKLADPMQGQLKSKPRKITQSTLTLCWTSGFSNASSFSGDKQKQTHRFLGVTEHVVYVLCMWASVYVQTQTQWRKSQ